jgi:hypothetical protein
MLALPSIGQDDAPQLGCSFVNSIAEVNVYDIIAIYSLTV